MGYNSEYVKSSSSQNGIVGVTHVHNVEGDYFGPCGEALAEDDREFYLA